jgi:broad specificity phosphatase PhoE
LVVASPLRRARDTAAAFGVAVEVDERWIELDYGELDGLPPSAVAEDVWVRWRTDASFTPPGGESLAALGIRVRSACESLADAAASAVVVVVTHVSPIKAAMAWALDVPETIAWRMYVEDASVSRIDISPAGPVMRWFNRGLLPTG